MYPARARPRPVGTVGSWAAHASLGHADATDSRCLPSTFPGASRSGRPSSPSGGWRSSVHAGPRDRQPGAELVVRRHRRVGRRRRRRRRSTATPRTAALPWLLMALGQALFVAGDMVWNWYEMIGEDPFPSFADVAVPRRAIRSSPPASFLLIRRRLGGGDRGGLLDAAILTDGLRDPVVDLPHPAAAGRRRTSIRCSLGISLAYPLADLLLIGVAMGLLTTPGARTTSFRLLAVSLAACSLVADQIYALQNLDGTYVSGGPHRHALPRRLPDLRRGGRSSVDAPPDRPASRRRHVARPGAAGLPGRGHGHRPAAGDRRPRCRGRPRGRRRGSALLSLLVLVRMAGLVGLLEARNLRSGCRDPQSDGRGAEAPRKLPCR